MAQQDSSKTCWVAHSHGKQKYERESIPLPFAHRGAVREEGHGTEGWVDSQLWAPEAACSIE
eukprot:1146076-Pelagomonas_calceolata.AAC.1